MFAKVLQVSIMIVLAAAGASETASARHRHRSGEAAAGEFDYYLLSLSWSPAFCLESPGAAECNGPRRFSFIVHGLWPQNESGWPEYCAADAQVPDLVVQQILDIMPARGLIYHEWSAHGSCSGLAPADFFALVRRAYDTVAVPAPFGNPRAPVEQSPAAIVEQFLQANPRLPAQSLVVTCTRQSSPRLREIHVCFDRGLEPRACSADALREGCRAPAVIVPPIR